MCDTQPLAMFNDLKELGLIENDHQEEEEEGFFDYIGPTQESWQNCYREVLMIIKRSLLFIVVACFLSAILYLGLFCLLVGMCLFTWTTGIVIPTQLHSLGLMEL